MKTDEMIRNLSGGLKPADDRVYSSSILYWSTGTTLLLAVFFFMLPLRADLGLRYSSHFFQAESLLLLALFFGSTWIAYRSAIPGLLGRNEQWVAAGLIVLLGFAVLSQLSVASLHSEFLGEMKFYRGRCGPILLSLGGLQTLLGIVLARRAAPTNLLRTGAWLGVSAGALSFLATQLICDHENFLHLVIWHALPSALLVGSAAIAGRRFLRW